MARKRKPPIMSLAIQSVKGRSVADLRDCVAKGNAMRPKAIIRKGRRNHALIMLEFDSDETKYQAFESVGMIMAREECHEVVIVVDAITRFPSSKEEAKYVLDNWETEQPSSYPESMRQDCLVIQSINFKGMDAFVLLPYKKKDGVVEFVEPPEYAKVNKRIEMQGMIRDSVAMGFLKAMVMKRLRDDPSTTMAAMAGDKDAMLKMGDNLKREYPNITLKERKHEQATA